MQTHRKYLVPTIWISTLAFIGAGFVGWGAYDYGNNKSDTVALVGDREITMNELQTTYNNVFGYYNQLFGGQLTKEKAAQLHLQDIALNKLTDDALLLNYADSLGISAMDEEVIEEYTSTPAFQVKGVFSKERYQQVLRAQSINQKVFEDNLRKGIILKKLRTALKLPVTPLESEATFAASSLEDHLIIKKITQSLDDISLSEEQIKAAWEKSKSNYLSPTTYTLETIKVNYQDFSATPEEVENYYKEKKYQFKDKDGKILALEKAKDAVTKAVQMKKAKTAVLKKYLAFKKGEIKAEKTINVAENNTSFPIADLKSTHPGEYIKAIYLSDGYITAKVDAIQTPKPLAYEDAKAKVTSRLRQEEGLKLLEGKAKEATKNLVDGEDIGFVSIKDVEKIKSLQPPEAAQLLRHVFTTAEKNGYLLLGTSAIVYQVKDQKLFDQTRFKEEKEKLSKRADALKNNSLERGLIETLKQRYNIQSFMKKEG